MKITTQMMGTARLVLSIVWMGVLVLGLVHGLRGLDWAQTRLDQTLAVATKNLSDVSALLSEITDVVEKVDQLVGTIEHSTINASLALGDTRPLLDESSQVITEDVPKALDDVQTSMPSVIAAAASIDETLLLLSNFRFEVPNIFGQNWEFSLGIDYDPALPLELALRNLSDNLEGVPESMRGIENDLSNADGNLVLMSDDLLAVASDLDKIREQMADINPQIEAIILNLEAAQTAIGETWSRAPGTIATTRKIFSGLMVLLILSQVPSAYFGYLAAKGHFPA